MNKGAVSLRYAFISYVREDAGRVDRLQSALEAAGILVWRDTTDLWPGEDWRARIRQAINSNALVFIACFSRHSLARERSYQNEELALAVEELRLRRPGVPWIIPVRFDDCDIPDLDIGSGRTLRALQRADLFGELAQQHTARLVTVCKRILGLVPTAPANATTGVAGGRPVNAAEIVVSSDIDTLSAGLTSEPATEAYRLEFPGYPSASYGTSNRRDNADVPPSKRLWLMAAYLLPLIGLWIFGFPALLLLMLKRDRAVRMNAMQSFGISLVLLPQFLTYLDLGSIAQIRAIDHYIVGLYTIGYTVFGALLLFCLIQVIRRKQPYIIGLSPIAFRVSIQVPAGFGF